MMNQLKMIVVIAGSHRQFMIWCGENHINPRRALYVSDPHALRGLTLEPWQVVRWGTYNEREDITEIERELEWRYVR